MNPVVRNALLTFCIVPLCSYTLTVGARLLTLQTGAVTPAAVAVPVGPAAGRLAIASDFARFYGSPGVAPWYSSIRSFGVSGSRLRVQTSLTPSIETLGTAQSICAAASDWVYEGAHSSAGFSGVEVLDAKGRPWVKRLHYGDSCAP